MLRDDLKQCVESLGFIISVNKLQILGYVICITDELNIKKNWSLALKKCYSIVNKLTCFSLSTRSKIMLIKTFILSQICYIARCFRPDQDALAKLKDLICNFINYGREHFSRANIFKPLEDFGLGIPGLEPFCMSLLQKNCSRAVYTDQPWADILKSNFKFNLLD